MGDLDAQLAVLVVLRAMAARILRGVLAGFCICWSLGAHARGPEPRIWVNAGVLSLHFDRDKDLREDNVGLGVEGVLRRDHAVMAGTFINSNRARTRYAGYAWRPLHWQAGGAEISAGAAAGVFDGYPNYRNGDWFLAALPLLAIEGRRVGLNVYAVPTIRNRLDGALAFQLKVSLP